MAENASGDPKRRTKVQRVIDEYDLGDLGDELAARWTGADGERQSLRALADEFNRRVLESALGEAGVDALDGEVANYYRLLTGDVSAGKRTEAASYLERAGVDVDSVREDFVSHQAIHTFLTERKGASVDTKGRTSTVEGGRETINRLQSRVESVSGNTIDRLRDNGELDLQDFSVLVSIDVICEECSRRHDVGTLLAEGGCECQRS